LASTRVEALIARPIKKPVPPNTPPAKPAESCGGDYGTNVKFVATPSLAAKQALKEEKLVCVLHVSGLFEDPNLT
jgi:hypothetical protein